MCGCRSCSSCGRRQVSTTLGRGPPTAKPPPTELRAAEIRAAARVWPSSAGSARVGSRAHGGHANTQGNAVGAAAHYVGSTGTDGGGSANGNPHQRLKPTQPSGCGGGGGGGSEFAASRGSTAPATAASAMTGPRGPETLGPGDLLDFWGPGQGQAETKGQQGRTGMLRGSKQRFVAASSNAGGGGASGAGGRGGGGGGGLNTALAQRCLWAERAGQEIIHSRAS